MRDGVEIVESWKGGKSAKVRHEAGESLIHIVNMLRHN